MSPAIGPDDEDRLRRGLASLADEAREHVVDPARLSEGAVATAHRMRVRRRVAAAGAAALVAVAVAGVAQAGGHRSAQAPPAGRPSGTDTPAPTGTASSTPSDGSTQRLTGTQQGSLAVRLTLTSGAGSADGSVFVARWTITWSGGTAPADAVLLSDSTGPLARSLLSVSCADPKRSGRVEGQVAFRTPGPHVLTAVVRTHTCRGTLQRSTDVVRWTWSASDSVRVLPPR